MFPNTEPMSIHYLGSIDCSSFTSEAAKTKVHYGGICTAACVLWP